MKPETQKLLEETKQRLFESDEFARDIIRRNQATSGKPDNLDMLLDRVDRFAPAMQRWADSFDEGNIADVRNTCALKQDNVAISLEISQESRKACVEALLR